MTLTLIYIIKVMILSDYRADSAGKDLDLKMMLQKTETMFIHDES